MNNSLNIYNSKTGFVKERISYFNQGVQTKSILSKQVVNGVSGNRCSEGREEFSKLIAKFSKKYTSKKSFIKATKDLKEISNETGLAI